MSPQLALGPHFLTTPFHNGLDMGGEPSGQWEDPRVDMSIQVREKRVPLTAGEENKQVKDCVCADS